MCQSDILLNFATNCIKRSKNYASKLVLTNFFGFHFGSKWPQILQFFIWYNFICKEVFFHFRNVQYPTLFFHGIIFFGGDSGGPLVCRHGDQWIQVRIASFTSAQYPGDFPGAFTRVTYYADWIRHTIANNWSHTKKVGNKKISFF